MNGDEDKSKKGEDSDKIYKEHCPVCGSCEVTPTLATSFHGVPHHFCSDHCLNRFTRRPHLYVGSPPHKMAVKQQGKVVEKSHHIALQGALTPSVEQQLLRSLKTLPGVAHCRIESADKAGRGSVGADLKVTYDLIVVSLKDIEQVVERVAGPLDHSLTERAKRKALHFGEENELDNLGHLSGSGAHYRF